ncbi:hypothetical protein DXA91_12500 [Clostridium sp. OF09-10]|nr:hypothetical protein DXA91_12500 [Clostridium sp. OF09-10]
MAKKSKQTQAWQSRKSRECLAGAKAEQAGIDGQKIHLSLFSSERRNLFTFPEIPFILGKAHILAVVQRGCAVPARTGKRV